jgi:predicted small secreted protein
MSQLRRTPLAALALAVALALSLGACGDTWQGLKRDTKENTAAVGRGVERGGEKIQDAAE